eukprot:1048103-Prymnesium_polylepis.1
MRRRAVCGVFWGRRVPRRRRLTDPAGGRQRGVHSVDGGPRDCRVGRVPPQRPPHLLAAEHGRRADVVALRRAADGPRRVVVGRARRLA